MHDASCGFMPERLRENMPIIFQEETFSQIEIFVPGRDV
jgi:hypothetical protein